jgi:hypothetical protein
VRCIRQVLIFSGVALWFGNYFPCDATCGPSCSPPVNATGGDTCDSSRVEPFSTCDGHYVYPGCDGHYGHWSAAQIILYEPPPVWTMGAVVRRWQS